MIELADNLRAELRRFDLNLREVLLAGWLLDLTLAGGLRFVRIQKLDDLVELTGFSRGDVSRTLTGLDRAGIIQRRTTPEGLVVTLLPDSRFWRARIRIDWKRTRAARENILASTCSGQIELLPESQGLTDALAAASLDGARAVVDLTTGARPERCQIDNQRESPMFTGQTAADAKSAAFPPSDTPFLRAESSEFKGSKTLSSEPLKAARAREDEILAEYCRLCGPASLSAYGGAWRNRIRRGPKAADLVRRVLAEVEAMDRRGEIREDAGAVAIDLFRRWGGNE